MIAWYVQHVLRVHPDFSLLFSITSCIHVDSLTLQFMVTLHSPDELKCHHICWGSAETTLPW